MTTRSTRPFDVLAGAELPTLTVGPIDRQDLVRYAGASGDFNPNHTVESAAQAAGFKSVFAHGMFHAGVMGTFVTDIFGPSNVRRFKVQFRDQVWPDDVLTFTGKVISVDDRNGTVDLEMTCTRQNGSVALLGWATFVAASAPAETAGTASL
jgi:acyl dehydratase